MERGASERGVASGTTGFVEDGPGGGNRDLVGELGRELGREPGRDLARDSRPCPGPELGPSAGFPPGRTAGCPPARNPRRTLGHGMGPAGHSLAALAALGSAPFALGALAVRPDFRVGLSERLGLGLTRGAAAGGVWIHGASVGEALASLALVDGLRARGRLVCVSTLTLTGREVVRARRPALPSSLAPLDHPWSVAAALDRAQPAVLALVETELWPTWIREAHERGIGVVSVSARLSERSLRRWRRLPWLSGPIARRLTAVGARTTEDAERFAALGVPEARIRVTGDLKLEPPAAPPPPPPDLEAALGVPLLVAASTHTGEEAMVLEALALAERGGCRAALLLAPRHPERFREVAAAVRSAGRVVRRRSALGARPLAEGEVLLLDSLGELGGLFSRAACGFVGGSLVDRGGHNVLEPAVAGCPVVVGPHTANVEHAVRLLEQAGALERAADAAALGRAFGVALADPAAARRRGERGRTAVEAQRGVAERSAALVEDVLTALGGVAPGAAASVAGAAIDAGAGAAGGTAGGTVAGTAGEAATGPAGRLPERGPAAPAPPAPEPEHR